MKEYKTRCSVAIGMAIKKGHIQRCSCEVTSCTEPHTLATHHDYNKPLDIYFLCHAHNRQWKLENKVIMPEPKMLTLSILELYKIGVEQLGLPTSDIINCKGCAKKMFKRRLDIPYCMVCFAKD